MFERRQYNYETSSIALRELAEKGYQEDFNLLERELMDHPYDFRIIYIYRYEGNSNPDDESTVYGIEKISTGEKGVLVAGNLGLAQSNLASILIQLEIEGRATFQNN
ncbi:hypothetical protein SAMN05421738_10793 [Algoriella xinjiangensis]|uniref:Uncharacterized protein n=1 Tax=Algoriella xinjiangensis TaxID=684065 RepID=A0A1I4WP54_9FLAO|nr:MULTISPECIES: hypothetical protein [Algoriella]MBO6212689.1 hypothetical protein [Algoriella sp.]SFN14900.1 hypothetical protein SAMN05421738_10793 [Algoriella xinjiangensis]VDH16793.1 Uncharacterised protein [Algoriella xinjiangensis]